MENLNLQGVASTLLVPLACRAIETMRPDAILRDPKAVEVYTALGGTPEFLMGVTGASVTVIVMRAREFDRLACAFLARHPDGLIVDIGCGLDTRFHRLDHGNLSWLGVDLPEVIELRRRLLPDAPRCQTIAQSMLDLSWLDTVEQKKLPVIFLAEGVFPYFSVEEIRPMLLEMAARFPVGELVFDAAAPFVSRHHNRSSSVLKRSGVRVRWFARVPRDIESWGLRMLDCWYYFDNPEPRLRASRWMRWIPFMAKSAGIFHFRLTK